MAERKYDKKLAIKTTGLREWDFPTMHYNRYEATPYQALDELFGKYSIKKMDQVVDFGCGRGRVAFYIHNRFQVPVTGVEVNDKTFGEAIDNKKRYLMKAKHINAPLKFKYCLAQHYEVKPTDNIFYFFNPFSAQIFNKVIENILESVKLYNRTIEIILYYPLPAYKEVLNEKLYFKLIEKVKLPWESEKIDKFLIYRLDPEDIKDNCDDHKAS